MKTLLFALHPTMSLRDTDRKKHQEGVSGQRDQYQGTYFHWEQYEFNARITDFKQYCRVAEPGGFIRNEGIVPQSSQSRVK